MSHDQPTVFSPGNDWEGRGGTLPVATLPPSPSPQTILDSLESSNQPAALPEIPAVLKQATTRRLPALPSHGQASRVSFSDFDAIARDFSSSASSFGQVPTEETSAPNRTRSVIESFSAMKHRVDAFSSRMGTESVKRWELAENPQRSTAPMWERKLLSSTSAISWNNVHQPAIVLQRFIRRMQQRKAIRNAVHFHGTSSASQSRVRLLVDLVQSERRYVHKLQLVCNSMLPQLQELPLGLFNTLLKIEYLHREMLAAMAKRQQAHWLEMHLGDIFCHQLVPRLLLYVQYAQGHKAALEELQEALAHNPTFRAKLRHLEAGIGVHWPGLDQLLLEPLQRLPEYSRALGQLLLLSGLDPGEDEHYSLGVAIAAIQQASAQMQKAVHQGHEQHAVRQVHAALGIPEQSVGPLKKHGLLGTPGRPGLCYFLLLDAVLLGLRRGEDGCWGVAHRLDLGCAALEAEASVETQGAKTRFIGLGNAFVAGDGATNLTLLASCPSEKASWVQALQESIGRASRAMAAKAMRSEELERRKQQLEHRAELLEARLEDERLITEQIGVRALGVLEGLSGRLEQTVAQLEAHEEAVLWPAVVDALLRHQKRPEAKPAHLVAKEQFERLGVTALEAGVAEVDQAVMQTAEELVQAELQLDEALKSGAAGCWQELEQQFGGFFGEMRALEQAMETNLAEERAELLVHSDGLRQEVSALGATGQELQDQTEKLQGCNKELVHEIAEQREELELLRQRLEAAP